MSTKVIVTNDSALRAKYGAAGKSRIDSAVKTLIAADAARGLKTRVVAIDSAKALKAAKGKAVGGPADVPGAKRAIDAVARKYRPDYVMILGGVDIVPHQQLVNGAFEPGGDDDRTIPSDLPYACEAPYSTEPADFVGATRVVGRLPDITGASPAARDAEYLAGLLGRASAAKPRPAIEYASWLGISAEVWKASTEMSLATMFGADASCRTVPPEGPTWAGHELASLVHFINCHGASADPNYYGQPASGASQFPVALRASDIAGALSEGTVIAPECCYGAELYDPTLATHAPMVNTALGSGASGFFGASTIAYGPADGNDMADLVTRFFLQQVLAGASVGRAALVARQRYVQQSSPMNPIELKTLAQFSLFGDPSVHPVMGMDSGTGSGSGPAAPKTPSLVSLAGTPGESGGGPARSFRRATLLDTGLRLGASVSACVGKGTPLAAGKQRQTLTRIAARFGVVPGAFRRFPVLSPMKAVYTKAKIAMALPDEIHMASQSRQVEVLKRAEIRTVIALVRQGEIVSVKVAYSR